MSKGNGTAAFVQVFEGFTQEGDDPNVRNVVLIKPGRSKNGLKWEGSVLRAAHEAGLFDGKLMFEDHNRPNPYDRKVGSIRSRIDGTKMGPQDELIAQVKFLHPPGFADFAQEAKLGTSVVVHYLGERGKDAQGSYTRPTKITSVISTDWVAFPANEGTGIYAQESFEVERMTPEEFAQLKKDQPELFAQESSSDAPVVTQEMIENAVKKVMGGAVETAVRTATEAVAQEAQERIDADKKLDAYLAGVTVPATSKARLRSQFAGERKFDEDKVKLACEGAVAEFAEFAKANGLKGPVIKGAGMTTSAADDGDAPITTGPDSSVALEAVNKAWGSTSAAKS